MKILIVLLISTWYVIRGMCVFLGGRGGSGGSGGSGGVVDPADDGNYGKNYIPA